MGTTVDLAVYGDARAGRGPNQAEQYAAHQPAFYAATDAYLLSPIGPGNEPLRRAVLELLGRPTPCQ